MYSLHSTFVNFVGEVQSQIVWHGTLLVIFYTLYTKIGMTRNWFLNLTNLNHVQYSLNCTLKCIIVWILTLEYWENRMGTLNFEIKCMMRPFGLQVHSLFLYSVQIGILNVTGGFFLILLLIPREHGVSFGQRCETLKRCGIWCYFTKIESSTFQYGKTQQMDKLFGAMPE